LEGSTSPSARAPDSRKNCSMPAGLKILICT
jgi:hypothetical protein